MKLARAPVLHLVVGTSLVRAEARRGGTAVWAGEAPYESLADLTEVVARLAAVPSERCRRLRVTVERPPAQTRTLKDLPPVRERELASLVATHAGRFFRRNGAPLVTDAIWVTNGSGRVTQAAAAEEPLLVAIVAGAAQAGLIVESITPAGLSAELQLLPSAERAVRLRAGRRAVIRFAVAAGAIWLIAGALFGIRLIKDRHDVDAELAAASTPLDALRDVRRELHAAETMVITLADAKRSRGQALATLARVKAAIPDSAVLTAYTWRADGSGLVAGAGPRAADVLAAVERSRAVANPRVEGAVVREAIAGRDWERFTIVFGAGGSTP
jgi:hypothetical protein